LTKILAERLELEHLYRAQNLEERLLLEGEQLSLFGAKLDHSGEKPLGLRIVFSPLEHESLNPPPDSRLGPTQLTAPAVEPANHGRKRFSLSVVQLEPFLDHTSHLSTNPLFHLLAVLRSTAAILGLTVRG
jgi:hypothetical protein